MEDCKAGSETIQIEFSGSKIKTNHDVLTALVKMSFGKELRDLQTSMLTSGISAVTVELTPEGGKLSAVLAEELSLDDFVEGITG